MTPENVWVRGETVANLVTAMQGLEFGKQNADGLAPVGGNIGDSAIRALTRIDAELLLEDSDALNKSPLRRTDGQRRAGAFAQLGREIASAMNLE
ncbi:MAG TPA: hypothetical protein VGN18_02580 [Jatrophihabitans sp.]|jgi:hypothetical protein|uniref:hypothetical protein n=1 Tax=Jatrophihabitans sp. TaxID=1932789 RepID=UPI002E0858FE|nr:hypothetical protein [Jatrophihabitans sp.]